VETEPVTAAPLNAAQEAIVHGLLRELRTARAAGQLDDAEYHDRLARMLERRRVQIPMASPDRRRPSPPA
jgi:hypothetical protein